MVEKVLFYAFALLLTLVLLVYIIESVIIPLDINSKFRIDCRNTLLSMETSGALSSEDKNFLIARLEELGLDVINVEGTSNAKYGEEIYLFVEAKYSYTPLTSLIKREPKVIDFRYDKYSRSRHVFN